ncbi:hypothetical protein [Desulfosarcina sp.]
MIYTVTINPALDRFIVVAQLLEEDTTRILSKKPYAAGITAWHSHTMEVK